MFDIWEKKSNSVLKSFKKYGLFMNNVFKRQSIKDIKYYEYGGILK